MREFSFSDHNSVSTDILYKGTSYKKGYFLVSKNEEYMEFGELLIILIRNDLPMYFVMDLHKAKYHSEYHLYSVTKQSTGLKCLHINDLADFYPLPSCMVDGYQVIPLKHSMLSN